MMLLFRDLSAAVIKAAIVVIALGLVYPFVVTTLANAFNAGSLLR